MKEWQGNKCKEPENILQKITLKKRKKYIYVQKLTFNLTYYPVFQNRNTIRQLHFLLPPDSELGVSLIYLL